MLDIVKHLKNQHINNEILFEIKKISSMKMVQGYFESMTLDEFNYTIKQLMETDNHSDLQKFLHYLIVFRDLETIQNYLNDDSVPIEFLEKLLIYALGYSLIYDYTIQDTIGKIFSFMSKDRLSKVIGKSGLMH